MADDFELDTDDLGRRMDGAISNLRTEFASLRTGRASGSMLEPVMVDAYGSMTPVNQVGTVNVPEPRMVTINVWDKGLVGKVELIEFAFVVEYVQSDALVVFEYVQQSLVTYAPPVTCAAPQPATEGTKQLPREDDGEQYEYGMW